MSVYTTLFVTPISTAQPTHTQIGKLVDGLVSNNFVVPPWGVVEGTFNPGWPEYIG